MTETYLEHHGVKGQKWGIRKQRPILGTGRRRGTTVSARNSQSRQFRKGSNRTKKVLLAAGTVGTAAVIAAGAVKARKVLKRYSGMKLGQVNDWLNVEFNGMQGPIRDAKTAYKNLYGNKHMDDLIIRLYEQLK